MKPILIEVCANSAASCVEAARGGAARVELCAALPEGGTTPSLGEVAAARKAAPELKLHVLIRPRAGDFCYSELELQTMEADIEYVKAAGADGVVFGCLRPDGTLDTEANARLLRAAAGLSTTFHRAFDVCVDPRAALEELIAAGFDRVLTSGAASTALDGADLLAELVRQAAGRIAVMPGCGVNENNAAELAQRTGAVEFHSSAREELNSPMAYRNPAVSMGGVVRIDEYKISRTSARRVAALVKALCGDE